MTLTERVALWLWGWDMAGLSGTPWDQLNDSLRAQYVDGAGELLKIIEEGRHG